jgi:hypothetical protein
MQLKAIHQTLQQYFETEDWLAESIVLAPR